jgi:tetratricopeptide (TPR) repeat protein
MIEAVEPLEPPETHYLSGALGWLGLGNVAEAKAELGRIAPARQNHPDVLEVRWQICAEEKRWEDGLQVARALIHAAPERVTGWLHQAYALRRTARGGLQQAWDVLLPAFDKFAEEPIVSYNLACYACQLGQLESARSWLRRAVAVGGKDAIRRMALADADLQPLWEEIKQL